MTGAGNETVGCSRTNAKLLVNQLDPEASKLLHCTADIEMAPRAAAFAAQPCLDRN